MAAVIFALVFLPMIIEASISSRNEHRLRARGAREPQEDVFRAMQFGYPAAFLVMVLEAWWRQPQVNGVFGAGLAMYSAAKVIKYWAIATLGWRWTFRVLVPPDAARVVSGPYRCCKHPNYIAVIGELLGVSLMTHAIVTGPPAVLLFSLLIRRRIVIEERALGGAR